MEVVPTSDGDEDDGVIWFRCPQCQGFLPKLSGADEPDTESGGPDDKPAPPDPEPSATAVDANLPWDSPADMLAEQQAAAKSGKAASPFLPEDEDLPPRRDDRPAANDNRGKGSVPNKNSAEPAEPIAEYAALLAGADVTAATPYRPWSSYEVGQCVLHLAWEDCGVVVAKEELPGGRRIIKCYFEDAGVVRLIEQASR